MTLALVIARSDAAVTLHLEGSQWPNRLTLFDATTGAALESVAREAATQLTAIVDATTGMRVELPTSDRDAVLQGLREVGYFVWSEILGRYKSQPPSLGEGRLFLGDGSSIAPMTEIECTSDESFVLPVELIPGLVPSPGHEAAELLGFGAAISRTPLMPRPPGTRGPMSAQHADFYWNYSLKAARREQAQMRSLFKTVLAGPAKGESTNDIARRIVAKGGSTNAQPEPAIEHLACHFSRGAAGSPTDRVVLRPKGWRSKDVAVPAAALSGAALGAPARGGLVFLNGCGSQTVDPGAATSMVRVLTQLGRDTVITTWAAVPDDVGERMARYFYEAFLSGANAGVALWVARNRLLAECSNPLGLLYTVHGDSTVTLARLDTAGTATANWYSRS